MKVVQLEIAGTSVALEVDGEPPARLLERYGAFAARGAARDGWVLRLRAGAARDGWVLRLRAGAALPWDGITGGAVADGSTVRAAGAEAHGALDLRSRSGEALLDPHLLVLDPLLRAALAADVLARGGCLVHAAAVVVDGGAHLAPGRSGAGKSTLASLAGEVLTDELVALLPEDGRFRAHGTPWWTGRPRSAPLAAIHSLSWDGEGVTPLPAGAPAVRHLAANLVLPVDGRAERAAAFRAACRAAGGAPFARLAFRRDSDVDALLRAARCA